MNNFVKELDTKKDKQKSDLYKAQFVNGFKSISHDLRTVIDSLEKTGGRKLDKSFVEAVNRLEKVANSMKDIKVSSDDDIKLALHTLAMAFNSIQFNPVVSVAPAKVTVPEINTKPLENAIKGAFKESQKLELSDFKAQDINEDEIDVQYVGFVNPSGQWMIIKNEADKDRMRYKFGKKGYESAFKVAHKYTYKTLDEAINAL